MDLFGGIGRYEIEVGQFGSFRFERHFSPVDSVRIDDDTGRGSLPEYVGQPHRGNPA